MNSKQAKALLRKCYRDRDTLIAWLRSVPWGARMLAAGVPPRSKIIAWLGSLSDLKLVNLLLALRKKGVDAGDQCVMIIRAYKAATEDAGEVRELTADPVGPLHSTVHRERHALRTAGRKKVRS
jgi:hypothetical protein